MEKVVFDYKSLDYKYLPLNVDSSCTKILGMKFTTVSSKIFEINMQTGEEVLYRLKDNIKDRNPCGIYDYGDKFVIIFHTFEKELVIHIYNKKQKSEVSYTYLKGQVEAVYSVNIDGVLYVSIAKEKPELYTFDEEKGIFPTSWEGNGNHIVSIRKNNNNLFITTEVSLVNNIRKSYVYDRNWVKLETISLNKSSDDSCLAFDNTRNIKLIVSNVLGKDDLFLNNGEHIFNIALCNPNDTLHVLNYFYQYDVVFYQIEKALGFSLNMYEVATEKITNILNDQVIFLVEKSEEGVIIVGNGVESELILSYYDFKQKKITKKFYYPQYEDIPKIPIKKEVDVNGRKLDYVEYPPYDPKKLNGYIIYIHGGPSTHWIPRYNKLLKQFQKNHFAIIYPNYFGSSNYGKIDYSKQENKWGIKDLEEIQYIGELLDHNNIILIGESYGGYLAMKAWNQNPSKWSGVIAYAPFYTPWSLYESAPNHVKQTVKRHIAQADVGINHMVNQSTSIAVQTKIYLIHGHRDNVIPYDESEKILKYLIENYKWQHDPELIILENVAHASQDINSKYKIESLICKAVEEITKNN